MAPPVATETYTAPTQYTTLKLRGTPSEVPAAVLAAKVAPEPVPAAKPKSSQPELAEYTYARYLPAFNANEHYPPLEPFTHSDPGLRALAVSPNPEDPLPFLQSAESVTELTPELGTEVRGVDLSKLTSDGRDQLALLAARRGVLVFRDQGNFINAGGDAWLEWGKHFGRLHIHPTSGHPDGIPQIHLVYRDGQATFNYERSDRISSLVWHSDVSYELQPPGLTTLFLLSSPDTGGDTLYGSQVAALRHLSPPFVSFLRTLKAVHSGVEQANFSRSGKRGGVVRREPVEHVHPVVRRHPVTGEEALYVNSQFTTRIVGLKKEESDNLLNFLFDHVSKGGDFQARAKWARNTVVLWDNRICVHTPVVDFGPSGQRRHGCRITPQAERPAPAWDGLELSDNSLI
ncbi:TauD-domain-containing protein [Dacryopinax primogenitus]|uniref:TauD-domain-containing protein n=1 Tax=Dacryopinax primogenitus (strain DJM 731) TaxID=1858805 RepID=M5FQX1_DACPD|nr:TauD-domain-containing protein [Dacryopinax primogenitus]EJT97998.1 TauD-domain-containing protein [Dacryopinax primogenitus]